MHIPWSLALIIGGLALIFLTSYSVFGWIVLGLGIARFIWGFLILAFLTWVVSQAPTPSYRTNFGRKRPK